MRGALNLDGGDGGALKGGEQDSAERVADGGAKATLERLDGEASVDVAAELRIGDDT